jgi:hypothetical protein
VPGAEEEFAGYLSVRWMSLSRAGVPEAGSVVAVGRGVSMLIGSHVGVLE